MGSSVLSLPGAAVVSTLEAYVIVKFYPQGQFGPWHWKPYNLPNNIVIVLVIFGLNYALLFAYLDVVYPTFLSPLRNIPRPKSWRAQIIYRRFKKTQGEVLAELFQNTENNGVVAVRELTTTRLLVTAPPLLADLLVHRPYDFEKAENTRRFLREILGDGLIVVEGEQHKFLRKNTLPAFGFRHIKNLYPMMWKKALICTERIQSTGVQVQGGNDAEVTTDMAEWANNVTLDIIGIAGLGRDFNLLQNGHDQIAEDYEAIFEPNVEKILYILLAAWFSFPMVRMLPWKMNDVFQSRTKSLRATCKQLILSKREDILKQHTDNFDILSTLVQTDNFSDEELSDQLLTFLAAGHDTTAPALTWACYLLAVDQEQQDALRQEIQDALAGTQLESDVGDIESILERLPLLNGVLNETLRLYPTVPVTIRTAIRDTSLGEQHIPQGTEVLISPWVINRSKDFWGPDADAFKPKRWINNGQSHEDEDGTPKGGSNYHFMTFLHGPRSCIGQNFAKAELRCLLAAMALRFSWILDMDDSEVVPAGAITIKPAKGLRLRLKPTLH